MVCLEIGKHYPVAEETRAVSWKWLAERRFFLEKDFLKNKPNKPTASCIFLLLEDLFS